MPSLRERPQDIPLLASQMMRRIAKTHSDRAPMQLSDAAMDALKRHGFPGNVRELENILERATALCDGLLITPDDLYLPHAESTVPRGDPGPDSGPDSGTALEDYLGEIEKKAILQALDETRWNRTAAAKQLGMTLRSLRYRLDKLGIE